MISFLVETFKDFIGLIYPEYCRGCNDALVKGEDMICTKCILEMPRSNYHFEKENPFYQKLRGRLPLNHVMTLFKFTKGSRVQQILHVLKYKNEPELGNMLGRVYGNDLANAGFRDQFDLIVPVPLHPAKKKRRGYNQSEEFGKGLSESLEIPCVDDRIIARKKNTETQTKKSRLNRWENVSDIFEIKDSTPLKDKRILLVDDVLTTGATLEACGAELLKAGCKDLSIACIASA